MAEVKSVEINKDVKLTLRLSKKEYELIAKHLDELIVLPVSDEALNEVLVTGKIGTGNRIMVPNKLLEKHKIPKLIKRVKSRIFATNKGEYLVISLEKEKKGIPVFEEE